MGLADKIKFRSIRKSSKLKIFALSITLSLGVYAYNNSRDNELPSLDNLEEFSHSRNMILKNNFEGKYYSYNVTDFLQELPQYNNSLDEYGRYAYGVTLKPNQDLPKATTDDFLKGMFRFKRVLNDTHNGILITQALVYGSPSFNIIENKTTSGLNFTGLMLLTDEFSNKDILEDYIAYSTYEEYVNNKMIKPINYFVPYNDDFDMVIVNPLLGHLMIDDIKVDDNFPLSSNLYKSNLFAYALMAIPPLYLLSTIKKKSSKEGEVDEF